MKSSVILSAILHAAIVVWILLPFHRPPTLEAVTEPGVEVEIAVEEEKQPIEEEPVEEEKQPVEEEQAETPPEPEPAQAAQPTEKTEAEMAGETKSKAASQTEPTAMEETEPSPAKETEATAAQDTEPTAAKESAAEPGTPPATAMAAREPAEEGPDEKPGPAEDGAFPAPETAGNAADAEQPAEEPAMAMPEQPDESVTRQEYAALKNRVSECWKIPEIVDTENLQIVLDVRLSRDAMKIPRVLVNGAKSPAHQYAIVVSLGRNLTSGTCELSGIVTVDSDKPKTVRLLFEPDDF